MYLALYRKWRPQRFDDVVGQEHITTTLKNQIKSGQIPHAYLFTGSRGTGKTTCSKILSMAVNCLHPQEGNPCMECANCKAIEDGSMLDVLEIDAASNNGVSDVRLLREEAVYTPSQGKFRVYIIDEAHMLSVAAFNALLKTMEEPPAHVLFILATTEAHKVPATILSRCQRFDFNRIATEKIADHLLAVSENEPFTIAPDAAQLVARLADGGMRDALSILDQCTAFSTDVTYEVVAKAVGLVLRDYLFSLVDLIKAHDAASAIQTIDELHQNSKDLQRLLAELLEHYRNLMIAKTVPDPATLITCMPEEIVRLQQQASDFPIGQILYGMTVLQTSLNEISREYNRRICVEMAMIRLCIPQQADLNTALLSRVERLEQQLASGTVLTTVTSTEDLPMVAQPVAKVEEKPIVTPVVETTPKVESAPVTTKAHPQPQPQPQASSGEATMLDCWPEILHQMQQADPMMYGLLSGSIAYQAGDLLFIDSPNHLLGQMIRKENLGKKLLDLLQQRTGTRFKLRIKSAPKPQEEQEVSPLGNLVSQARAMGVEVHSH